MNIVKGTILKFDEAIFTGSWKRPKFSHEETHTVKVIKESYGSTKGQHSFTLEVIESTSKPVGSTFRKMGRNLYKTATILEQPNDFDEQTKDKNERAKEAQESKYFNWAFEAQNGKPWKLDQIPQWFKEENKEFFDNLVIFQ